MILIVFICFCFSQCLQNIRALSLARGQCERVAERLRELLTVFASSEYDGIAKSMHIWFVINVVYNLINSATQLVFHFFNDRSIPFIATSPFSPFSRLIQECIFGWTRCLIVNDILSPPQRFDLP
jgi:hypothetical protein